MQTVALGRDQEMRMYAPIVVHSMEATAQGVADVLKNRIVDGWQPHQMVAGGNLIIIIMRKDVIPIDEVSKPDSIAGGIVDEIVEKVRTVKKSGKDER